jgi:dihydrofolate reductase
MTLPPSITLVVAMDAARGIGIDNALPWHLPEDLAHFKRVTTGHPIIMGRKTFDSIGRPLPNRRNIVITRAADVAEILQRDGVDAVGSLAAAIALVDGAPACIIGGAQIFAQAMEQDLATRMIVTEIAATFDCDTFFPPLPAGWLEVARERHQSASGIAYSFVTYEKAH